jgi:competence protein ComEA
MSGRTVAFGCALLLWSAFVPAQEINTATRAELEQLNGVGVTLADRILAERERGPFRSWDDLERRVKGMRGARAQRLQAQGVTVNRQREMRPALPVERKP